MTSSSKIIIAVAVVAVVIIAGLILTASQAPQAPINPIGESPLIDANSSTSISTSTDNETHPAAEAPAEGLPQPTTIDQDLADIDTEMSGLNEDSANIDKGLTDSLENPVSK